MASSTGRATLSLIVVECHRCVGYQFWLCLMHRKTIQNWLKEWKFKFFRLHDSSFQEVVADGRYDEENLCKLLWIFRMKRYWIESNKKNCQSYMLYIEMLFCKLPAIRKKTSRVLSGNHHSVVFIYKFDLRL